ncbi:hypothetical protein Tcan_01920 [Toxocara canis]|uniref:Uncharacterized protein n=1 Tax=Toxocara canis TaxID=6265 RepID=A0A0B2VP68_TOXCA|nr:hypothetical protein Tcan_01920 [Toxocara canis]
MFVDLRGELQANRLVVSGAMKTEGAAADSLLPSVAACLTSDLQPEQLIRKTVTDDAR